MKDSLAHTVWACKNHIVWVPKRRRKVIFGQLRREIGTIIRRLCKYKGIEMMEGNTGIDHILHILVLIPPKYSVATIAGYLKGKSAMIVFEKYSNLRKNFKGHNFWARGYYVSTVGLDEAKVRKYIKEQEMKETIEDKYDSDLSNPF